MNCPYYDSPVDCANQHATALDAVRKAKEALRIQDPRNATERYERIASEFHAATGYLAPGKSLPLEMQYTLKQEEERQWKWRPFVDAWHERFFDAALAKLRALVPDGQKENDNG